MESSAGYKPNQIWDKSTLSLYSWVKFHLNRFQWSMYFLLETFEGNWKQANAKKFLDNSYILGAVVVEKVDL